MKKESRYTFWLLLFVALVLRVISELLAIDGRTGFFISEYKAWGIVFSAVSLLAAGFNVYLRFRAVKPSVNSAYGIPVAVAAALVGIFSLADGFKLDSASNFASWQVMLVSVACIVNAVFFFLYAVANLIKAKIPKGFFAIPLLYIIIRFIRFFAVTTSIAVISDNVFTLLFYSSAVFFLLEFANVGNAIGGKSSLLKMRIFGYLSAELSLLAAIPRLIKLVSGTDVIVHESVYSTLLVLSLGVFAFVLTYNVFDKKAGKSNNNTVDNDEL